ncbi:MAG: hypothetical protein EHM12_10405, partial [Dehalococcoidia bacterium]
MQPIPRFPHFRPIELDDRPFIGEVLVKYGPETSELTFTNLFIWRNHYSFQWSVYKDWLCITGVEGEGPHFAMEPVGPATRADVAVLLLEWLRDEKGVLFPSIERADSRLACELAGRPQ